MTTLPSIKQKTCRVCKEPFAPFKTTQAVCGMGCARKDAQGKINKQIRRENKGKLNDLKSKSEHLNELQEIFNRYIVLRDKHLPCVSCGTTARVIYSCGHYQAVGGHANLRFNEDNCWKQCLMYCNKSKHGNLIPYRIELVKRIGVERVEALESNLSRPVHYSIPEIIELKSFYKQKINQLKNT